MIEGQEQGRRGVRAAGPLLSSVIRSRGGRSRRSGCRGGGAAGKYWPTRVLTTMAARRKRCRAAAQEDGPEHAAQPHWRRWLARGRAVQSRATRPHAGGRRERVRRAAGLRRPRLQAGDSPVRVRVEAPERRRRRLRLRLPFSPPASRLRRRRRSQRPCRGCRRATATRSPLDARRSRSSLQPARLSRRPRAAARGPGG